MGETEKGSEYYALQHFISDAPWDAREVMNQVSKEVNTLLQMEHRPIGFLVDVIGTKKKAYEQVNV